MREKLCNNVVLAMVDHSTKLLLWVLGFIFALITFIGAIPSLNQAYLGNWMLLFLLFVIFSFVQIIFELCYLIKSPKQGAKSGNIK
jgi:hypothetical protein